MSYCFKIPILAEICIKMRYFNWKNYPALGALPSEPHQPLPPLGNPGYTTVSALSLCPKVLHPICTSSLIFLSG